MLKVENYCVIPDSESLGDLQCIPYLLFQFLLQREVILEPCFH